MLQPLKDPIEAGFALKAYYNNVALTGLQKIFSNHLFWSHHLAHFEWLDQHCILIIESFTIFHQIDSINFLFFVRTALKLPFLNELF